LNWRNKRKGGGVFLSKKEGRKLILARPQKITPVTLDVYHSREEKKGRRRIIPTLL